MENCTFNTSDVPLSILTNGPVEQIDYSLNKTENGIVSGNTTLNGLTNGQHTITIYATGKEGVTSNPKVVSFTIAPQLTPTLLLFAIAPAPICLVVAILFLRRHRKTAFPIGARN